MKHILKICGNELQRIGDVFNVFQFATDIFGDNREKRIDRISRARPKSRLAAYINENPDCIDKVQAHRTTVCMFANAQATALYILEVMGDQSCIDFMNKTGVDMDGIIIVINNRVIAVSNNMINLSDCVRKFGLNKCTINNFISSSARSLFEAGAERVEKVNGNWLATTGAAALFFERHLPGYYDELSVKLNLRAVVRTERREFAFGEAIVKKLFSQFTVMSQYPVLGGKYRIDWYIPELNIAIEFDETHHQSNKVNDAIRQDEIERTLGCTFLRYNDAQGE